VPWNASRLPVNNRQRVLATAQFVEPPDRLLLPYPLLFSHLFSPDISSTVNCRLCLLNSSTWYPTVGVTSNVAAFAGLMWLMSVVLPELSRPITRIRTWEEEVLGNVSGK